MEYEFDPCELQNSLDSGFNSLPAFPGPDQNHESILQPSFTSRFATHTTPTTTLQRPSSATLPFAKRSKSATEVATTHSERQTSKQVPITSFVVLQPPPNVDRTPSLPSLQATLPSRPTVTKQASLPSRWSNTGEQATEPARHETTTDSAKKTVPKWVSNVRSRVPLVSGSVSIHRFRHTSLYANTPATKPEVVEFLKRDCTDCNLSQRVVVEVLLLGESSIIVMGSAGSGKSHAMAKAMKKAVDTFIFTKSGQAADNLLRLYCRLWKTTMQEAVAELDERNVQVNHLDGFFHRPPYAHSLKKWQDYMRRLPAAKQKLVDKFRRLPRQFWIDEAFYIEQVEWNLYNDIIVYLTTEEYNRRAKLAKDAGVLPVEVTNFFGVSRMVYVGDPNQLVPRASAGSQNKLTRMPHVQEVEFANRFLLEGQNRQQNAVYAGHLESIARGEVTKDVKQYIQALEVVENPGPDDGTLITFTRKAADDHNWKCITEMDPKIHGEMYIYNVSVHKKVVTSVLALPASSGPAAPASSSSSSSAAATSTDDAPTYSVNETTWVSVDRESDLFRAAVTQASNPAAADRLFGPDGHDDSHSSWLKVSRPLALRIGVPVIAVFNDSHECTLDDNTARIRNGTEMIVVGFKGNDPVFAFPDVAKSHKEKHGFYGYTEEDLEKRRAVVVTPRTVKVTVRVPAANGRRMIETECAVTQVPDMRLCWGRTAHSLQGATIYGQVIILFEREFAPGLANVALSRGVQPPKLARKLDKEFDLKLDIESIQEIQLYRQQMVKILEFCKTPLELREVYSETSLRSQEEYTE